MTKLFILKLGSARDQLSMGHEMQVHEHLEHNFVLGHEAMIKAGGEIFRQTSHMCTEHCGAIISRPL
jgi:hypothetical protein